MTEKLKKVADLSRWPRLHRWYLPHHFCTCYTQEVGGSWHGGYHGLFARKVEGGNLYDAAGGFCQDGDEEEYSFVDCYDIFMASSKQREFGTSKSTPSSSRLVSSDPWWISAFISTSSATSDEKYTK